MKYVIYLDVFFVINFVMDFIILCTAKRLIKLQTTSIKCLAGAAVGALLSVLCMWISGTGFIKFAVEYILIVAIMNFIAFNIRNIRGTIKGLIVTYAITFILGGVMNFLYYHTYVGAGVVRTIHGFLSGNISIMRFIGISLISYVFLQLIVDNLKRNKERIGLHIYNIKIKYNLEEIKLKGIYDTGNTLFEPISGDIVHIVSSVITAKINNWDEINNKMRLVPYNSINGSGILYSIIVDKIEIYDEYDNLIKEIINPRIGLSNKELSANGEFQMILNRGINL